MEIPNKYKIGQEVCYLDSRNRAQKGLVVSVRAAEYYDKTVIYYGLKDRDFSVFSEDELFGSFEQLRKHIFGDIIEFV